MVCGTWTCGSLPAVKSRAAALEAELQAAGAEAARVSGQLAALQAARQETTAETQRIAAQLMEREEELKRPKRSPVVCRGSSCVQRVQLCAEGGSE